MHTQQAPDDQNELDERVAEALRAFGAGLRERRRSAGLSQEEAAGRVGITQSYLSRLETGGPDPSLGLVLKLARVLDLESVEALFGPAPSRRSMGAERSQSSSPR